MSTNYCPGNREQGTGKNMVLSLAQRGINVILTYNSKKTMHWLSWRKLNNRQKDGALQLNTW
jgi:hypothetical protein